jgi:hypothetical protein
MEPTLTQNGALYLAHHKSAKRRIAFFRQFNAAARKRNPDKVRLGESSRLPTFNPDNGR